MALNEIRDSDVQLGMRVAQRTLGEAPDSARLREVARMIRADQANAPFAQIVSTALEEAGIETDNYELYRTAIDAIFTID
jgi:hypothetical protein